ncbi:hypothetical protein [Streptomyces sp. NPDC059788]|uniref:hypothetical protein n=1 Tax=Streptomyces sp. NPDC059788 TaxID=3346948 RepID=UPI0036628550
MGYDLGTAVGPALGGVLLAVGGPRFGPAIDAAGFGASALLVGLMPSTGSPGASARPFERPKLLGRVSVVTSDAAARTLCLSMFAVMMLACLDNAAAVFLMQDSLCGSVVDYVLMMSAFGIGMIVGPLAISLCRGNIAPFPQRVSVLSTEPFIHPWRPAAWWPI